MNIDKVSSGRTTTTTTRTISARNRRKEFNRRAKEAEKVKSQWKAKETPSIPANQKLEDKKFTIVSHVPNSTESQAVQNDSKDHSDDVLLTAQEQPEEDKEEASPSLNSLTSPVQTTEPKKEEESEEETSLSPPNLTNDPVPEETKQENEEKVEDNPPSPDTPPTNFSTSTPSNQIKEGGISASTSLSATSSVTTIKKVESPAPQDPAFTESLELKKTKTALLTDIAFLKEQLNILYATSKIWPEYFTHHHQVHKGTLESLKNRLQDIAKPLSAIKFDSSNKTKENLEDEWTLIFDSAIVQEVDKAIAHRLNEAEKAATPSYFPSLPSIPFLSGSEKPEIKGIAISTNESSSCLLLKKFVGLREETRVVELTLPNVPNPLEFKEEFDAFKKRFSDLTPELMGLMKAKKEEDQILLKSPAKGYEAKIQEANFTGLMTSLSDRLKKTVASINTIGNTLYPPTIGLLGRNYVEYVKFPEDG